MKSMTLKQVTQSLTAVALVMLGSSAFAASTWTKSLQVDCSSNAQSQDCNNLPAVTVSGWTTGTGTQSTPTAGTTFANSAVVYNWGTAGLGIVSGNEKSSVAGPHAIDNAYGIEAMMLQFTTGPVNLSGLTIGWNGSDNRTTSDNNGSSLAGGGTSVTYNDSDLSVLAWTGNGAPVMAGATLSSMLTSGWTLIGNYSDVGTKSGNTQALTSSTYSSYWLISAYSSAYGESWSTGNDAFKVLSIAGSTYTCSSNCGGSSVPEPGSLALIGAAMMGYVASRRRKQKTA